jgi:NAD+ kinase
MAFDRSVVVAPDEPVAIRVLPHSGQVAVSVDGQLRGVLEPGDWIAAFGARYRLRVLRLGSEDFYGRLRDRFQLSDAPATAADGQAPSVFRPPGQPPADVAHLRLPPPPAAPSSPADGDQ